MAINKDRIRQAVRASVPLTLKTYTLPHETEVQIEAILKIFLSQLGQERLHDHLTYCIRELAVNAKKANTKRVYFKERGLSLQNPTDYQRGMETFKKDTMDNINHYLELQKKENLYIKVVFHSSGENFTIAIKNNVEITRKEQMRIYDRIARSRAFESMEEAFSEVLDDSEGAGLGIVIMVLMLKKLGLDEEAFDIDVEGEETVARIVIPISQLRLENLEILSRKIVDQIQVLPQFPENIVTLQAKISDPDSEMADIARIISSDPSLTADLLKVVNSAQYMLPKKVDNIFEAVKLVGLKGLKNLLYSYGTQKVLKSQIMGDQKELWEHSHRTGFYAYALVKNFPIAKQFQDDVYVGGILHDMGKIVFSAVHPHLLDKIDEFCKDRDVPSEILEDLSAGLNHAEIGALIAEKWNFPPSLITAIAFHHEPLECDPEFRDIVYTVYLANAICNLETNEIVYDQIDPEVLSFFGITSEKQFTDLRTRFAADFEKERQY